MAQSDNPRRTFGDLRAPGGVYLRPDGVCLCCKDVYEGGVRKGAIDKGGVRRFNLPESSLICDFCIEKRAAALLPIHRKLEEMQQVWKAEETKQ
jgi:hypothetical protein